MQIYSNRGSDMSYKYFVLACTLVQKLIGLVSLPADIRFRSRHFLIRVYQYQKIADNTILGRAGFSLKYLRKEFCLADKPGCLPQCIHNPPNNFQCCIVQTITHSY